MPAFGLIACHAMFAVKEPKYLGLMMAIGLFLIFNCGCHHRGSQSQPVYGANLPESETDFLAMGDALIELDRDRTPLERLDAVSGEWAIEATVQSWKHGPISRLEMISDNRWILGNRCLHCRLQYSIPGETIADLYIISWDPIRKDYGIEVYSSGWPLPSNGRGTWDEKSRSLNFTMKTTDPVSNEPLITRYSLSDITTQSHRWTQYRTGENGTLVPIVQMSARRVAAP